jgi:hypothetical protein
MIRQLLNFLKFKQNSKNWYKKENNYIMTDVQDKVKQYQWIKGDTFGKIVTVESVDGQFTNFTDGSRIFNNVISEFLQEVTDGRVPLPGADKLSQLVQGDVNLTETKEVSIPSKANSIPEPEVTVMGKMIQKMSKKNVVSVPIQINLNIPTPALHTMLSEGMEAEDLNEEIMAVALQQINVENLQSYIQKNITKFLEEYYK